jgi:hypothetical protein
LFNDHGSERGGLVKSQLTTQRVQASLGYKQRLQQLFFLRELPSMENGSIEPPQGHHFSSTWRRLKVLMIVW